MPPLTLTALRFAIAVPVFVLFGLGRLRLPWKAVPNVAALGVLGIGVGQVAQTFGIAGTSASVSTIISATIPLFVVVFASLRLRQSVGRLQQVGLLAAFGGIALVAFGQGDGGAGLAGTTLSGVALVFLSAVTIAFYYVWSIELTEAYGTVTVSIWSTLAGFLVLVPFSAWEMSQVPFTVEPEALAAAAYLGILVTVAGLFLWLWLLRTVPARVAASVQFLQPVFGIAASAALFGDRMGTLFMAGVVLILVGVGLAIGRQRTARQVVEAEPAPVR
ncbi:DMT family transporter [Aureimonas psammosilenae]|uniref:DMT family transporter n=1 Tax=Aureimonas psammosilenae TaxID=2495496 RepID=UPI002E25E229